MTEQPDALARLRQRRAAEGAVFLAAPDTVAIFDPELAAQVNQANFADQNVPDPVGDFLAGRSGPVSWKHVRAAWAPVVHELCGPTAVDELYDRMAELLAARAGHETDLVRAAHEVCSFSLLPSVVSGLSPAGAARVRRDVTIGFTNLSAAKPLHPSLFERVSTTLTEMRAGFAIRGELRGRAHRKRPRQPDLTDPLVDLLPQLGYGRAVDAVTALLTAIAGPPGAIGACVLYALQRYPRWAKLIHAEMQDVAPASLHHVGHVPVAARFVKEALRLWSPPLLLARPARVPIDIPPVNLQPGQRYLLSPHMIHHDGRNWPDPESFNPDRWIHRGTPGPRYIPFGFPPKSCVGAGLGTIQMMLLCHLLSTRFRVRLSEPADAVGIAYAAVAVPVGLRGTITEQ